MADARLLCALFLSTSACSIPDPNHCANLEGDASCAEDEFCSACLGTNRGCAAMRPTNACAVAGPQRDPTGPTTTGEPASSSSGAPPPECTQEGQVDAACPDATPMCSDGACVSCSNVPVCDNGSVCIDVWARCAECSPFSGEGCDEPTWCGDNFACGGCTRHEQCPESACDLALGQCMPTDRVYYVDNTVCPSTGQGTQASPFCSLTSVVALENTPNGESAVAIVVGNGLESYRDHVELPGAWPRTLAVLGRGDTTIGFEGEDGPVFHVKTGSRLYLHNLVLTRSAEAAVHCVDAQVWVDDSEVVRNASGMLAEACELTVRRTTIRNNEGDGITLEGESRLRLESSAIVSNGSPEVDSVALRSLESAFDIVYSTIVANEAPLGMGGVGPTSSLWCAGGIGGPVRNSVVVGSELVSISCPWASFESSFIDTPGLDAPASLITDHWDPTWFESLGAGDVHVRTPDSNPWVQLATWELEDPQRDLDGALRGAVPGSVGAAGADQP